MTVETFDGTKAERKDCRKIGGKFYEINRQCFLMEDGRWHRINNGQMVFNYTTQKHVLKRNRNLSYGVVDIKDGNIIEGYFDENLKDQITTSEGVVFMSVETALKVGYKECLSDGRYYKDKSDAFLNKKGIGNSYRTFNIEYGAKPSISMFSKTFKKEYIPKCSVSEVTKKALEGISFGIEFETSNGFIPEAKTLSLGLIPLKDGSLRHDGISPYEYTTIPLTSKTNGLEAVSDICDTLDKYTEISHQCSLHVHIGGIPVDKEYVVAARRLGCNIQDELYHMLPSNYRYTSDNGFKEKDYCIPLKKLGGGTVNDSFNKLLSNLGCPLNKFGGIGEYNHPSDPDGHRKWNITNRYVGINFIPTIWGGSGTVEFRMHNPTINKNKVINWIFICSAILRFASRNKEDINIGKYDDITLSAIISRQYDDKIAKVLNAYIVKRTEVMKKLADSGDYIGDKELKGGLESLGDDYSLLKI